MTYHQQIRGIVLNKVPTGENHLRYTFLSSTLGLQSALFRVRTKNGTPPAPDFFDLVELSIRHSTKGSILPFAKESECLVLSKRSELGTNHNRFVAASRISRLFLDNGIHLFEPSSTFSLLENSLDALIGGGDTTIIHLKTLFVFARGEGHPVKQAWFMRLDPYMREGARIILENPVSKLGTGPVQSAGLLKSLTRWLNSETEFIC